MPTERPARDSDACIGGPTRVGLISDTHGWLDPRAFDALDSEQPLVAIVHAGDIGETADVLYELGAIARVIAVLGNCDYSGVPGKPTEKIARATFAGQTVLVIHDLADLGPIPGDVDVVVRGHSHVPSAEWRDGVLVVNPGSATQRRRQPSCTVGVLEIAEDSEISARIIDLDEFGPRLR